MKVTTANKLKMRMGYLTLFVFTAVVVFFLITPQKATLENEIINAGGSATGNALEELAQSKPSPLELQFLSDTILQLGIPMSKATITSLQPEAPLSTSAQKNATEQILEAWISAHRIQYKRAFQISPTGDNYKARLGIMGPAFADLTAIPGGVQSGDLILYRDGLYTYTTQFPKNKALTISVTTLAWPNEQPRIAIPNTQIQGIQSYGLQWVKLPMQ